MSGDGVWNASHPGLRLLRPYGAMAIVGVPTLDRLVVFRSEVAEHEVLEVYADGWALTAWYSARP